MGFRKYFLYLILHIKKRVACKYAVEYNKKKEIFSGLIDNVPSSASPFSWQRIVAQNSCS